MSRWLEFLYIYVAGRVPTSNPFLTLLAPVVYAEATGGAKAMTPPPLRFTDASVSVAKADFVAQDPRVRVLFDNGGGTLGPGALQPTFEADYRSWPPAETVTRYYLGSGGTLAPAKGATARATFRPDPSVRPATDLPSGNVWVAQPPYDWTVVPAANGVAFETPAFSSATTIVGPASLDLWLRSTAPDTYLQVTVTEVRPGETQEEYVTSGFLRAGYHTLSASSTALQPAPEYLKAERDLPAGRATLVRIPIDPIAHAFRAGTRLRIVISAPGGDRPSWAFALPATHGSVTDTVSMGGATASSLVVNVVHGVDPTTALPACGALRGEPCRPTPRWPTRTEHSGWANRRGDGGRTDAEPSLSGGRDLLDRELGQLAMARRARSSSSGGTDPSPTAVDRP